MPLARTLSSSLGKETRVDVRKSWPFGVVGARCQVRVGGSLPALWSCEPVEVLELLKTNLDRILCRPMSRPRPLKSLADGAGSAALASDLRRRGSRGPPGVSDRCELLRRDCLPQTVTRSARGPRIRAGGHRRGGRSLDHRVVGLCKSKRCIALLCLRCPFPDCAHPCFACDAPSLIHENS